MLSMESLTSSPSDVSRVAIFAPHPLLTVAIESRGEQDDVHTHVGGQGVWVARMAGELGAWPILCAFAGGETGAVIDHLLEGMRGELRLTQTASPSGCYVVDRRGGERNLIAHQVSAPPSRHELDDLFSATTAAAIEADVLVVCNPYPGDALPLDVFTDLVSDARGKGTRVLVDLSTPRLDRALVGGPDLVKINDWELAEYVYGPVSEPSQMRAAAERLRDAGAGTVVITRAGDPAFVLHGDRELELAPPKFERGAREGCGDSMMGGIAAGLAQGMEMTDALVLGAAAGAANFLRHGLGSGSAEVVRDLARSVELRARVAP
jgi:1-phosphofructokinase